MRWWLVGLALSLGDRVLPIDIRLGTSLLAGVILLVLPIVAYRRLGAAAGTYRLQQVLGYRLVLGALALCAGIGTVLAANTFIVEADGAQRIGPIGTAAGLLVIAVVAWRATVRPSPRAAAFTSLIAILAMILAAIIDTVMHLSHAGGAGTHVVPHGFLLRPHALVLATGAVGLLAQLTSIASLVAFEPASDTMPEARVSA